jgi:16S rRNA (guanine(1405)-N(7))-methyltransferase
MDQTDLLDQLVNAVRANPRYREIDVHLIQRIGLIELQKRRSMKEAVKETRNKLHQVGGAYQEDSIAYTRWQSILEVQPCELASPEAQDFCRKVMLQHASTRERLPILERFFYETLDSISPVSSVLDLACGLNPLAVPWMPLTADTQYTCFDIYTDLVFFLNSYFSYFKLNGQANLQDLLAPDLNLPPTQLALLLKTIPCLEQVDKEAGRTLLDQIPAEHLLVSFPVHSLGGRGKGMLEYYERHFLQLLYGHEWVVRRYEFATELAFLVSKK